MMNEVVCFVKRSTTFGYVIKLWNQSRENFRYKHFSCRPQKQIAQPHSIIYP